MQIQQTQCWEEIHKHALVLNKMENKLLYMFLSDKHIFSISIFMFFLYIEVHFFWYALFCIVLSIFIFFLCEILTAQLTYSIIDPSSKIAYTSRSLLKWCIKSLYKADLSVPDRAPELDFELSESELYNYLPTSQP